MISTRALGALTGGSPGRAATDGDREEELPRIRFRRVVLGTAGAAVALGTVGLFVDPAIGVVLVSLGLIPWLWKQPVRGLYLIAGMCALIQQFPLHYPDSLTDRIPLWLNLDGTSSVKVGLSPFEVILLVVAVVTGMRGLFAGRLRLSFGRLNAAYYLYGVALLIGVLNGLATGGSVNLMLWGLRPQAYGLILFLLTCALVRERRQVVTIGIVFVVTELMTAVLGDWRYFVTLQRNLGGQNSLLAHEDSYFLLLYVVITGVSLVWWRVRRLWLPLVLLSPLVLLALIQNNRRTGIDATGIVLVCFLVLVIRFRPDARKWAILAGTVIGGAYAILAAASWHVQYGIRSELVSPLRSIIGQPTARDLSSDAYRTAENANLIFTYHQSPITGWGLGKDFLTPNAMANISGFYSLWNLLPHNSLLWVPMSMGVIGLVTFWALVGLALMESIRAIRMPGDRLVQGLGAFCACAIVAELVFAYADLQLSSPRNMVTWGILLGLANVAPRLAARRHGAPPAEELLDGD